MIKNGTLLMLLLFPSITFSKVSACLDDYERKFTCLTEGKLPYSGKPFSKKIKVNLNSKKQFKTREYRDINDRKIEEIRIRYEKIIPIIGPYKRYPNITFHCEDDHLISVFYEHDNAIDITHAYEASCY